MQASTDKEQCKYHEIWNVWNSNQTNVDLTEFEHHTSVTVDMWNTEDVHVHPTVETDGISIYMYDDWSKDSSQNNPLVKLVAHLSTKQAIQLMIDIGDALKKKQNGVDEQ